MNTYFLFWIALLCNYWVEGVITNEKKPTNFGFSNGPFAQKNKPLTFDLQKSSEYAFPGPIKESKTDTLCINGKEHIFSYNVNTINGTFILLDNVPGLIAMGCNGGSIELEFASPSYALSFAATLQKDPTYTTFLSGKKASCTGNIPMMRRALDFGIGTPGKHKRQSTTTQSTTTSSTGIQNIIFMDTLEAKYDQIFEVADLSFGPSTDPKTKKTKECEVEKEIPEASYDVCMGVNENDDCTGNNGPFNIFSDGYVTITCVDCWLGLSADVFMDVSMKDFSLISFSSGFKDISVDGALVTKWQAHHVWSTGSEKTYPIANPTTVIDWWLGPIPFHIWFEIPLQVNSMAQFQINAQAEIGATMKWNVGDLYVSWVSGKGWSHKTPSPKFTWQTVIQKPQASFSAETSLTVSPSFSIHVDNFWTTTFELTPTLTATAKGSTKTMEVCAEVYYDVDFTVESELQVSIPWFDVTDSYFYGPTTIYDSGKVVIGKTCVSANSTVPN